MTVLKGKTALVTGASRGIGRATALALADAGAEVFVHYGRNAREAEDVVRKIRNGGGVAERLVAELTGAYGPDILARQVQERVGRLDILVLNAAMGKELTSIEATTREDFDRLFALNVRAPFFLVQALLPIMGDGSSITFLSSLAARSAVGMLPAYAATKGAVETMVTHFAAHLGSRGIRVNAVAPGVVATAMTEDILNTEYGRAGVLGMQALKRIAAPEDIGDVVAFLASPAARWITGETVHADGGSKL